MPQWRPPPAPAERRQSGFPPRLVLALCAWVVAHAVSASTAQAQCNTSNNPSPPPPVQANFSNQSFGMTPPLSPYAVTSLGIPGCDGSTGGFNQSGGNGSPGQPGGQISGTNTALTIIGGGPPDENLQTTGAPIASPAGSGGAGGQSGTPGGADVQGGNGGAGGAAGNITVNFGGTFIADPNNGLANYGLTVASPGGEGGTGGPSSDWEFLQARRRWRPGGRRRQGRAHRKR